MFRSDWLTRHATALAVASALLFPSTNANAQLFPLPTLATTDKGVLTGQSRDNIRRFLGVPYAAPPTGARRWKPPAAESAYLLRDATRFAAHCPQSASPFGVASTNEDCLYLNVYAPPALSTLVTQVPVLVWLHPGSFQSGESEDYLPTVLVKQGFVVVTLNYRLGALGWMAHPALTAESSRHGSGNYGLMDQQAALRWIQRNIQGFGGDPRSVTIMGADAGAVSVYAHIASPDSAGLFQRAIAHSGSYLDYRPERTQAAAEAQGQAFATAVGCAQQDLSCLRAVPVATLLAKQTGDRLGYLPNPDGAVLPEGVFNAIYNGHVNKVPLLAGNTRDEYRLDVALLEAQAGATTVDNYAQRIIAMFGYGASTANELATNFYAPEKFENSPSKALGALGTDDVYACPQYAITHYLARNATAYAYEFNDRLAPQDVLGPTGFALGAYHGSDIQYLLDAPDGAATFSADQQKLADTIKSYWTQFARTGNPNSTGVPAWPAYVDGFMIGGPNVFLSLDAPTPTPINGNAYLIRHGCQLHGPPYPTP